MGAKVSCLAFRPWRKSSRSSLSNCTSKPVVRKLRVADSRRVARRPPPSASHHQTKMGCVSGERLGACQKEHVQTEVCIKTQANEKGREESKGGRSKLRTCKLAAPEPSWLLEECLLHFRPKRPLPDYMEFHNEIQKSKGQSVCEADIRKLWESKDDRQRKPYRDRFNAEYALYRQLCYWYREKVQLLPWPVSQKTRGRLVKGLAKKKPSADQFRGRRLVAQVDRQRKKK